MADSLRSSEAQGVVVTGLPKVIVGGFEEFWRRSRPMGIEILSLVEGKRFAHSRECALMR